MYNYLFLSVLIFSFTCLSALDFTISSYNCGGLSDHYDYLRAGAMQKIMQERYAEEPELMSINEKIQKTALKILFASGEDQILAQNEWDQGDFQNHKEKLFSNPSDLSSPNNRWNKKMIETITPYNIRPVVINDEEVYSMLNDQVKDLVQRSDEEISQLLIEARTILAKRIFSRHLKFDIICLQETNYLDESIFPENYQVIFQEKLGLAWNKDRFELLSNFGDIDGHGLAVALTDKETGISVLVVSGHLTGCNPFHVEKDLATGLFDSAKGDEQLLKIVRFLERKEVDIKLIGMDSNVTALHPRLQIIKNSGYQVDFENYLEPTCASPHQVLNTRIDWIAFQANSSFPVSITNVPVMNVGLNSIQTNISDHKPIAAIIRF